MNYFYTQYSIEFTQCRPRTCTKHMVLIVPAYRWLVQERRKSIANARELRLSCTNLSICIGTNTVVNIRGDRSGHISFKHFSVRWNPAKRALPAMLTQDTLELSMKLNVHGYQLMRELESTQPVSHNQNTKKIVITPTPVVLTLVLTLLPSIRCFGTMCSKFKSLHKRNVFDTIVTIFIILQCVHNLSISFLFDVIHALISWGLSYATIKVKLGVGKESHPMIVYR